MMIGESMVIAVKKRSTACLITWIFSSLLMVSCTTTTTIDGVKEEPVANSKILENRIQLALGYMSKGDHEGARIHLNKAMEVDSRSPELHDVWALLYQKEREFDEAEAHYKKALTYDPLFTRGRSNYGLFLLRQGRYEEAYQQFSIGAEDLGYPRRAEMFYKKGIAAVQLGKLAEAESTFTRAAVLNPQLSAAYLELAELAYNREDYPRAKQLLTEYNYTKKGPSPKELWLGVRLERSLGNKDAEASQGMALRNLFPDSRENQEYQSWLKNEQKK
ncbi:MAG: type IV pilus biogenesis/stability protein PilW [Porticoccus sp.]|nr:type IV pilus biogenesis/stability protein PilW [Porticoccus sp.]